MNTLLESEKMLKGVYLDAVNNLLNKSEQANPYSINDIPNKKRKRRGYIVPVRTEPKIGRNEPCPCQSGKKYKYCCGK